ncbi:hypothetical protein V493_07726, partial [Pseudogymnoascus sp. VKM F-4281 (FW-2241)]
AVPELEQQSAATHGAAAQYDCAADGEWTGGGGGAAAGVPKVLEDDMLQMIDPMTLEKSEKSQ